MRCPEHAPAVSAPTPTVDPAVMADHAARAAEREARAQARRDLVARGQRELEETAAFMDRMRRHGLPA